jgi:hypothetical protein
MSDSKPRYFELLDEHGIDGAENREPLHEIGMSVPMPIRTDSGLTVAPHAIRIEALQSDQPATGEEG